MLKEETIKKALEEVLDPELNRNLVELNMVRNIKVAQDKIEITLALTTPHCPLKIQIKEAVVERIKSLPEGRERKVEVTFTPMTNQERAATLRKEKFQSFFLGSPASSQTTQIILVASGKGGVGKSTISANLGAVLSQQGFKVGILDADVYGFSIPRLLGIRGRPNVLNRMIIPLEKYGMKVMSMGFFIEEDSPIIWRAPLVNKAIEQLLNDVLWGKLDFLIVDLPPGTGDVAITITQRLSQSNLILVTTPQALSTKVAARVAHMAEKVKVPIIGVIENMSYFLCPSCGERTYIFGKGGGKELAWKLKVPFLGEVPLESPLREGGDQGRPIVIFEKNSSAGLALTKIVQEVLAKKKDRVSLEATKT